MAQSQLRQFAPGLPDALQQLTPQNVHGTIDKGCMAPLLLSPEGAACPKIGKNSFKDWRSCQLGGMHQQWRCVAVQIVAECVLSNDGFSLSDASPAMPRTSQQQQSRVPEAEQGPLKEAWRKKRALRQCLQEVGLPEGPIEKLLASTRNVGDHPRARLEFWKKEGPQVGMGDGTALEGHPWLLTCDYHEMLAIRGCLLAHGVSLRRNAKLMKYALKHGHRNLEQILQILEDIGVPDMTRVVHAYPRLLALQSDDLSSKVAYLSSLGLDAPRLSHLFSSKPNFIYPTLATMQSKVAYLSSAGFSQEQAVALIVRYPLALGSDLSSHFPRIEHLFQEYGFSRSDFLYVVERFPAVLLCRVEDNLRPKLAYFRARGLSRPQLVAMVKAYPCLLAKNLRSALKPKVEFLVGSMERDISELVAYASVLGYSMARLQRRQEIVAQYGISCSLSTMLSRTDAQFAAYIKRVSRQTFEAKMAGVRQATVSTQQTPASRPSALDLVQMSDFELPVYKMHSGGTLKWPTRR